MANTRRNELEIASALLHKVADGTEISAGDSLQAVIAAAAVDAILEPGGWTQIREEEGAFTTNLPLTIRESLRNALRKAAASKRKTLTGLVTKGYQEVLAGTWTPPKPTRAGRHPASDKRVVINVTVQDSLRVELRQRLPALSEDLGYPLTEGGIAIAYLRHALQDELAKLLPQEPAKAE